MLRSRDKFHSSNGKRIVLVVDDEMINREMLKEMLKDNYDIILAKDGEEALNIINENKDLISIILLDLMMPAITGKDLLRRIKANDDTCNIPVIVMTADQAAEVECLDLGAIDFIPKPYPSKPIILARIRRTIELSEDNQIIQVTERDNLTGLYNRDYFLRYCQQYDKHHPEVDMDAVLVDVNHFHLVNERYGKSFADDILIEIGEKLRTIINKDDGIVCRTGADTFLVYCPHREDYQNIMETISVKLGSGSDNDNVVRLRMGVYPSVDKNIDIVRRFDNAKLAADTVKNSYNKNIAYYGTEMYEKEKYNEQLINNFKKAIKENQFVVYYQPKFNIKNEKPTIESAEALVRWDNPELGLISPGVFIPLFEKNGLIQDLDKYVWENVACQLKKWKEEYGFIIPVSVNVSRVDMFDPNLNETFDNIIKKYGLSTSDLLLEITESAYTEDSNQIITKVSQLRNMGFKVEMDDFGTGYSSLNMISSLPIDALKIDMKFIKDAFLNKKDMRLIEVIIDIADYLGVPTIAEGVETEEQLLALKEIGCDIVQGYYFSKPIPAKEFVKFIEETIEK